MRFGNFEKKTASEVLQWVVTQYGLKAGLASSFGMEDMILIDMLAKLEGKVTIFTLDTGRLHEETYEIMERARSKYGVALKTYFPNQADVERLEGDKGFFSFKESVDNRKECCSIRKVDPLNRALISLDSWITGLRREQSLTRTDVQKVMEDRDHEFMVKVNPLADWSLKMVEDYIKAIYGGTENYIISLGINKSAIETFKEKFLSS